MHIRTRLRKHNPSGQSLVQGEAHKLRASAGHLEVLRAHGVNARDYLCREDLHRLIEGSVLEALL